MSYRGSTLLVFALVAGAYSARADEKPSAGDVAKKAEETASAAGKYANEKKDEFEQRMRSRLDDLGRKLKDLRSKAEQQGKRTKGQVDKQVDDLDRRRASAEKRLGEVKDSAGDAWKKLKAGVESAVDDLDQGLKKATQ